MLPPDPTDRLDLAESLSRATRLRTELAADLNAGRPFHARTPSVPDGASEEVADYATWERIHTAAALALAVDAESRHRGVCLRVTTPIDSAEAGVQTWCVTPFDDEVTR